MIFSLRVGMLPAAGLPAVGKFLTTHAYCDLSFLPQVVYLSFVLFTAYVSLLTLEYVDTFLFVASLVVLRRLLWVAKRRRWIAYGRAGLPETPPHTRSARGKGSASRRGRTLGSQSFVGPTTRFWVFRAFGARVRAQISRCAGDRPCLHGKSPVRPI
jgi:hypothetical protein